MLVALQHFARPISRPLLSSGARGKAHRAVIAQDEGAAHADLEGEWRPPYAPDLNPEEGCQGTVTQPLRNATPVNTHDLGTRVDRGFARLRQRPDLLLGFFRHARLQVNQLW